MKRRAPYKRSNNRKKNHPNFRVWKTENHMVMSWLTDSMNDEIGENFLLFQTAKEIWNVVKDTYSSSENISWVFWNESDLCQAYLAVTQCLNVLTRYWQQLNMFETHTWKCPKDTNLYEKIEEKKRNFNFLLGLNENLDEVRGRAMGTKPLPNLGETFIKVRREESKKKLMMGTQDLAPVGRISLDDLRIPKKTYENRKKGNCLWCDHCKKPRHSKTAGKFKVNPLIGSIHTRQRQPDLSYFCGRKKKTWTKSLQ